MICRSGCPLARGCGVVEAEVSEGVGTSWLQRLIASADDAGVMGRDPQAVTVFSIRITGFMALRQTASPLGSFLSGIAVHRKRR